MLRTHRFHCLEGAEADESDTALVTFVSGVIKDTSKCLTTLVRDAQVSTQDSAAPVRLLLCNNIVVVAHTLSQLRWTRKTSSDAPGGALWMEGGDGKVEGGDGRGGSYTRFVALNALARRSEFPSPFASFLVAGSFSRMSSAARRHAMQELHVAQQYVPLVEALHGYGVHFKAGGSKTANPTPKKLLQFAIAGGPVLGCVMELVGSSVYWARAINSHLQSVVRLCGMICEVTEGAVALLRTLPASSQPQARGSGTYGITETYHKVLGVHEELGGLPGSPTEEYKAVGSCVTLALARLYGPCAQLCVIGATLCTVLNRKGVSMRYVLACMHLRNDIFLNGHG